MVLQETSATGVRTNALGFRVEWARRGASKPCELEEKVVLILVRKFEYTH